MERHFTGSVTKHRMDDEDSSAYGVLSDFQTATDLVKDEPPVDQEAIQANAAAVEFIDPELKEEVDAEDASPPEADEPDVIDDPDVGAVVPAGGQANPVSNFNTALKQFNPRNEFHKLGLFKLVVKTQPSKKKSTDVYTWRIQNRNGSPDLRTGVFKVSGKNVNYTYAYCDWTFSHSEEGDARWRYKKDEVV